MDFVGESSKASLRRINKPLLEKRRRARINDCLNQLKNIVLEKVRKDTARYSKLEKADILEMTVDYLKAIRFQQWQDSVTNSAAHSHADRCIVSDQQERQLHQQYLYCVGYRHCADEIKRYLENQHQQLLTQQLQQQQQQQQHPHPTASTRVSLTRAESLFRQRLDRHLAECVSRATAQYACYDADQQPCHLTSEDCIGCTGDESFDYMCSVDGVHDVQSMATCRLHDLSLQRFESDGDHDISLPQNVDEFHERHYRLVTGTSRDWLTAKIPMTSTDINGNDLEKAEEKISVDVLFKSENDDQLLVCCDGQLTHSVRVTSPLLGGSDNSDKAADTGCTNSSVVVAVDNVWRPW